MKFYSDSLTVDDNEFIQVHKTNILMQNENVRSKICSYIFPNKTTFENIAKRYQIAEILKLVRASRKLLRLIQENFTMVAETQCFLDLDYTLVLKLLGSCNLETTSEIEVFQAADKWVSHKPEARIDYAKHLLLQIRFPLLSDHALEYVLGKAVAFKTDRSCRGLMRDILREKRDFFKCKSKTYFTNRYCKQQNESNKLYFVFWRSSER